MNVEVTGAAVPRLSRRDVAAFTRKVLLALDKQGRLETDARDVTIAFVDDEAMKNLNRKFRHKNKTTDVLTFTSDGTYLGDIVISIDQARRQSVTEKHSLATEIRYLIVHGLLHSLGYDHETDAGEMNELEVDVREAVGLE